MRGGLLTALILACATPAWADNTADEADIAFRVGNEAYAKKDYSKALAAYFLSHRLVPNTNVLYNIARCYEALKSYDEAYRYYFDLSQAKDLTGSDARDVKKALDRLSPYVALVSVITDPPGADVYIDREDLGSRGRSPQTLAIAPGPHKVKVKAAGLRDAEAQVRVGKGSEKKITLKLSPIVGTIEFTGSPEGASIRETEGGPELGKLPAKLSFPPGQRLFVVTHPGYNPTQLLVTVKADESQVLKASLTEKPPETGKVVVTANRENALVRVDGKDSGFTPTVLVLSAGRHEIEVSAKEQKTFRQEVDVKVDGEIRVTAELRYSGPQVRAASKSLSDVDEAAASITVISREEILAMGYQTLAEAVAGVRGIGIINDRIYSYQGIRGFSPPGDLNTRVLILWDGHAVNDIWAGQGYSARDLNVDISEIDRIEIVRGPGSALYGTGAFFAVINVVPRDVVAEDRNVEAIGGVGGLSGGKGHVTGSVGKSGPTAIASGAGFYAGGDPVTDLGSRGLVLGNDQERAFSFSGRARAGGFTVHGMFNDRLKVIPIGPYGTVPQAPGTSYRDVRGFAEVRWEKDWQRLSLAVRGYYDGTRFFGSYANPSSQGDYPDFAPDYTQDYGAADFGGVELRGRLRLLDSMQISLGVEGQYQVVQQAPATDGYFDITPTRRLLLSAYLLWEWRVFSRLSLSFGGRVDKYLDLDAIPISPRLALVARPYNGGTTKLIGGRAFRAPNVYELQYNDGNLTQKPSPNLAPENIWTVELEHSHDFNEELRLTVGGYFNIIDNLVVQAVDDVDPPECGDDPENPDTPCLINVNASGQSIYAVGAEAELRWQPSRYFLINATYSYVKLFNSQPDIDRGTATHLAGAKVIVPLKDELVRFAFQAVFRSQVVADVPGQESALMLNAGVSGQLSHVRYFAGINNLLDMRAKIPPPTQADLEPVPQYGRTVWVELAVSF